MGEQAVTSAEWYFATNGVQRGPIGLQALREMIERGEIRHEDLVWTAGMEQWKTASSIPELTPAAIPFKPMPAMPAYLQTPFQSRPLEYHTPQRHVMMNYAGFWLRFVAWIIDTIVLLIAKGIVSVAISHGPAQAQIGASTLFMLAGWLYFAVMESSSAQGTLGKMALGLRVADLDGQRISFGRATGRHFAKILSGITLGIGYMMAGWTQCKQALHDMIASCLVVRS